MQKRLWAYIGGIARTNSFRALAVGGIRDHAHALISIPATLSVSKALQLIKGGSSLWINDHLPVRSFEWQDSYGAFSIGVSQVDDTIRYINTQEKHHAKLSFADEFKRFLERHGMKEYEG
jgi:REP element-mobilizing transposase RayT